jgi:hypothetical protein
MSLRLRNWLYFGAAYVVGVISIAVTAPHLELYEIPLEAIGFVLAAAVPAFALQRWMPTRRAYQAVTLCVVVVLAFGSWYGARH